MQKVLSFQDQGNQQHVTVTFKQSITMILWKWICKISFLLQENITALSFDTTFFEK